MANNVVGWGTNPTHWLVWVLLHLDSRLLALANNYASNDAREHAAFRHLIVDDFLDAPWISSDDFKMVESQEDKEEALQ